MAIEKMYTVTECCEILHRTKRSVYTYITTGKLSAVRFAGTSEYRIKEKDLKNFIAGKF